MSKEWYDIMCEDVPVEEEEPVLRSERRKVYGRSTPGNLMKWQAFNSFGKLSRESIIKENGPFLSSDMEIVCPYTGQSLGIKANHAKGCPYYVAVLNSDGRSKHASYLATMSPREMEEIMRLMKRPLMQADYDVEAKFKVKVDKYNKNYPEDRFGF